MKKLIYLLALVSILFSCEKYNDQFEGYDDNTLTQVVSLEYTLTADDYDVIGGSVASNQSFSESNPPASSIPDLLASKYTALDASSSVNVTYNFKNSYADLSSYTGAKTYYLSETDYENASPAIGYAKYFSPKNPANNYIPALLSSSVTDAESGDVYIVSYMYSDIEPDVTEPEEIVAFDYEFEDDLGNFEAFNILGDRDWYSSSYSGVGYAKISGFVSGAAQPNEDWLVSPAIDLEGLSACTMNLNQAINFLNGNWDQISILISTDYEGGEPSTGTWTEATIATKPSGEDWDFVESGDVDISAYDGQTIHIAFRYISSDENAATWEINKLTVKGTGFATKSAVIGEAIAIEEFYTYTSSWEKTEGALYLTSIDYDAMGDPGKYNNFSSSDPAKNYLPQLANIKYPFAQEGDNIIMVYRYYSSSAKKTTTRGDELNFVDGAWQMYDPIVVKTDQYIYTKSNEWVFDPTINYTMVAADYQLIVDYVKANVGAEYVSSYGNNETYYGSNAYYTEFQIGSSYFDPSFASWQDAVKEALGKAFLPTKFPNAISQVDGIDVYYNITFAGYESSMVDYLIKFQCTKSGPNPEFEYIEGPTN